MKTDFIHFNDIDLNKPESWKGKCILSFDVDWAADELLEDCLNIVTSAEVKATFFITHNSPVLETLTKCENIELGIHPNFDGLIKGVPGSKSAEEIVGDIMNVAPDARVIRSHGMTHSGRWLNLYQSNGLMRSSQYFMNGVDTIQPFSHLNGVIEAPVYFADDGLIWEAENSDFFKSKKRFSFGGVSDFLRVYNFHPIHVGWNNSSYSDYLKTKNEVITKDKMDYYFKTRIGVKNILLELLNL